MIAVVDSGSTKSDWILINQDGAENLTNTPGFNPFFYDSKSIGAAILENDVLRSKASLIKRVYFFGAGCSSKARCAIVEKALKDSFTKLETVVVDHDLKGAALATCGNAPGITCILGTGSNSCYYDGNNTFEGMPSLGYVLGDEGSGTYFGKTLLSDWLYKRMPEQISNRFQERYQLSKEDVLTSVYNKPNANAYLASFTKFIGDYKEDLYFREMLYQGFAKFAAIHIWCYPNFRSVPVHFVGSIAYHFREELEEVANNHKFNIGTTVQKPILSLAQYFLAESKLKGK